MKHSYLNVVALVPNARNHGDRTSHDRPHHTLIIKAGQILRSSTTPRQNDYLSTSISL